MRFKRFLAAFTAALLAFFGLAPLFADDANVSATAPTQNTDGSALTDLAALRFYRSSNGAALVLAATVPATPGARVGFVDANLPDGRHCYVATAIDLSGNESAISNESCKDIDTLAPNGPTNLTVD